MSLSCHRYQLEWFGSTSEKLKLNFSFIKLYKSSFIAGQGYTTDNPHPPTSFLSKKFFSHFRLTKKPGHKTRPSSFQYLKSMYTWNSVRVETDGEVKSIHNQKKN